VGGITVHVGEKWWRGEGYVFWHAIQLLRKPSERGNVRH